MTFGSAAEASRRVAGVAAAARAAHALAERGFDSVWLALPQGEALGAAALEDLHRLAGSAPVVFGEPPADAGAERFAAGELVPSAATILRATAKPSDGPVSRWLNRPVSRLISAGLLRVPGVRPLHATIGTALITLAMLAALVLGGERGLIAGALLYQAASIFDGVDGEIARATFRSSRFGAALDTAIDGATNVAFIAGVALNLAAAGDEHAASLAAWGLALFGLGIALVGWRNRQRGAPADLERVKRHYRGRFAHPAAARAMALATIVTSRDFFALLFMVLVLAGLALAVLYIFAVAASVWIWFVIGSLVARPQREPA